MAESWKVEKKMNIKILKKEEKEETREETKLSSSKLAEEIEREEMQTEQ